MIMGGVLWKLMLIEMLFYLWWGHQISIQRDRKVGKLSSEKQASTLLLWLICKHRTWMERYNPTIQQCDPKPQLSPATEHGWNDASHRCDPKPQNMDGKIQSNDPKPKNMDGTMLSKDPKIQSKATENGCYDASLVAENNLSHGSGRTIPCLLLT